jgi:hypothetical protein
MLNSEDTTMTPTKALARIAGLLYLLVAVTTGVGGYARGTLVVAGDAAATAAHLRASETLFRIGIVSDLASATLFLVTAMALYVLLRNVDKLAAGAMVTLVAVAVAIQALNLVNELVALTLATGSVGAAGLGRPGADALTLLFVDLQHDGFVVSQVFFALWLLPLGYLVVRSGSFPRILGYLLWVACAGYLVDLSAYFLAPSVEGAVLPVSAAAGAIGELGFIAWLLVKGARVPDAGAAARVALTPAGLP